MGKELEQKKSVKASLRERVGALFGIPADAVGLSNGFMAELRGKSSVNVRGCRRILTYSPEVMRLDTRDGIVIVMGEELTCTAYFSDLVGIEGRIGGICFEAFAKAHFDEQKFFFISEDAE